MLVEDLLSPLRVVHDLTVEKFSKGDARSTVLDLLSKIERRPLRASEATLLKSEIAEYLIEYDLSKDELLDKMLSIRFSFSFMPGVTTLNLPAKYDQASKSIPIRLETNTSREEASYSPVNVNVIRNQKIKGNYFMCSVRRHQSTLWTSYRMFLDGTKEMNSSGDLTNYQESEPGNMLLGAKKLKSGISAQCFVWKTPESKGWKEKNAIGKIVRSNTTYIGMSTAGSSSSGADTNNELNDSTEVTEGATDWKEFGTGETYEPAQFNVAATNTTTTSSSSAPPTVSEGNNNSGAGAPIAISVNSRGLDKLIHLAAVFAKPNSVNPSSPSPFNFESVDDAQLVNELENVLKSIQSPGVSSTVVDEAATKFVVMKSKLPRKITSDGKKGIHTMAFSKESRVKSASRKNLVVDSIYYENGDGVSSGSGVGSGVGVTGGLIRSEWGSESERVPMLQIGKMEEDLFAVDFHGMTPFQAFAITIAAFDQ